MTLGTVTEFEFSDSMHLTAYHVLQGACVVVLVELSEALRLSGKTKCACSNPHNFYVANRAHVTLVYRHTTECYINTVQLNKIEYFIFVSITGKFTWVCCKFTGMAKEGNHITMERRRAHMQTRVGLALNNGLA